MMVHAKRVCCALLAVLSLLFCAACGGGDTAASPTVQEGETAASPAGPMDEVVSIRFVYPEFGVDILEYEIDLDGQTLRSFDSGPEYEERDPEAENGGWASIETLSEQQVTEIRRICTPMLQWEDSYENPDVQDGEHWYIAVTFRDGSTHKTGGANAWPEDYMQIGQELRETGVDVMWPTEIPEWATT